MTPLMGYTILTAGLLSVSIPIIIHLLHRQKTTPLLWGAMIFLKQSPLQMKRRKQVDHWLLMLLRMLVLAFLAYLVAQPKFNMAKLDPLSVQAADVAVVIDHSLSMGRRTGTRTLFEEARDVVDRLTAGPSAVLRGADTLSVVLAEHQPRKLKSTPRPIQVRDQTILAQIHDELQSLPPGTTDCTIPEAIAAAREMLSHGPNQRKIVLVVSDEQRSNWALEPSERPVWDLAIGEDTIASHRVEVHSYPLVPDETGSNITVGSISMQPSVAGADRLEVFSATVTNSGPQAVPNVKVQFSVHDANDAQGKSHLVGTKEIDKLDAKQSATVSFDYVFAKPSATTQPQPQATNAAGPESHWVKISTDVIDALAADNQSFFAVNVWKALPVLVIGVPPKTDAEKEARLNLEIAMRPDDKALIQPEFVDADAVGSVVLDKYFAVVLNDVPKVPDSLQEKLGDYVSSGRGLWVILGSHSKGMISSLGVSHQNVALLTANQSDESYERPRTTSTTEEAAATIEVKDPTNPIVTAFKQVDRSPLATRNTITTKWWKLSNLSNIQVVLESSSGDPLVLERQLGSGRVVVWTTSVDGTWNTWQGSQDFLPLVHETLFHLFPQACTSAKENIAAGQSFTWSGPAVETQANLEVNVAHVDVDHAPGSPAESAVEPRQAHARDGRYEFDYQNAFLPGVYKLTFPTAPKMPQPVYYGVGINPRELENVRLTNDDITTLTRGSYLEKKDPRIDASRLAFVITRVNDETVDWWKYLAALVVLSLCLETFMTFRMAGLQKNLDTATAGLVRAPA